MSYFFSPSLDFQLLLSVAITQLLLVIIDKNEVFFLKLSIVVIYCEYSSNAIRSGKADVQLRPFSIYSLTLSLERVKQVKSKLGAVSSLSTTFAMFLSPRRGPKGSNTCHHKLMLGVRSRWVNVCQ